MAAQPRIVVIITEGASDKLLHEFIDEGYLPGFSKLIAAGAWGEMESHVVPYEPPGLMTAFTGRSSAHHGWFSYWSVHEPDHIPRVLTSADVEIKPMWLRPKHASRHFSIVNVLGSHPPVALPGECVTYPMAQTLKASYPADLLVSLSKQGLPCTHDVSIWYRGQQRGQFLSRILEADHRRAAIALHLYENGADVVIVNLTSIDRACHYYSQELEPGSCVPRGESAILSAYRAADELISDMLEKMDDQTTLLAFSEIGFGPLKAYISVNDILSQSGLLKWLQPKAVVDWQSTVAAESVQGSSGININRKSRHPDGCVSDNDYESVRDQVAGVLQEAINPYTGLPLFSRVADREEIYDGPQTRKAPDLILFPQDHRYLPLGDPHWALHVNRHLQSGWHRDRSYWAMAGPDISSGQRLRPASLDQILPSMEQALCCGDAGSSLCERQPAFA